MADHGVSRIRAMKAPAPPSRQEVLEHNILHCPFRAWCPECVAGKCKSKPHVTKKGEEEQSVPLVAFDYAFLGDASVKASPAAEEKAEIKVLVGRDKKSRVYCSIVVPQKGVDPDEWVTRRGLKFLDFLGYDSLIIKSDQEISLGKAVRSMKLHRGDNTQVMFEESPVGDSMSNGVVERAIQSIEGQVRTLKLALENRLGGKLPENACVLTWLVEYAGVCLSLGEVGSDGQKPLSKA